MYKLNESIVANFAWNMEESLGKNLVEQVYRGATRMVTSIMHLSSKAKLRHLNLPSLNYWKNCGDMITT